MAVEKNLLAKNILHLRKELQLSQEELAQKIECKRSSIAAYESKNVEPRLELLLRMAELFDIDFQQFIVEDVLSLQNRRSFHANQNNAAEQISPILNQLHSPEFLQQISKFKQQTQFAEDTLKGLEDLLAIKKEQLAQLSFSDANNYTLLLQYLVQHNQELLTILSQLTEQTEVTK
ncbi:MAG: helix-turn-helix domain-containing protein [Saprospiraceae bacterium]